MRNARGNRGPPDFTLRKSKSKVKTHPPVRADDGSGGPEWRLRPDDARSVASDIVAGMDTVRACERGGVEEGREEEEEEEEVGELE